MTADPGQRYMIIVGGIDFHIHEPSLFNPKWYRQKFKGPGLNTEIGV